MIESLWLEYTVAAGAPRESLSSPSRCVPCTRAVRVEASWEPNMEASIITCKACRRLPAFWTCSMEGPPLRASRSSTAIARSSAPMTSTSSFSEAPKSASSFFLISVAAFRSASLVAMPAAVSSIFVARASDMDEAWTMEAWSSSASALAVFTSYCRFLERSSHHSLNSTYVWCAASPSFTTLPCRSVRSCSTFWTGLEPWPACTATARSANRPANTTERGAPMAVLATLAALGHS
mmetsp:Transcript_4158/g.12702  ORF Transcript_4158/g.12702 Transcript_4158/m.12702 type:complete len:236 (+) Transcript_4158:262-969(+)